jgi:hypothetical protein
MTLYDTMIRSVALGRPSWGEARDRVRQMIEDGADVECRITQSKRLIQTLPDELTYGGEDAPPLLKVAIWYNNGEAMKMLVDAGAKDIGSLDLLLRQTLQSTWTGDQETTERMISTMGPWLQSAPSDVVREIPNRKFAEWLRMAPHTAPQWLRDAWRGLLLLPRLE